ncbi:MAG: sulfatase-like hydrolase/transferase [Bryobacteraceae bacterium]
MRATLLLLATLPILAQAPARNVILITADGLRWQEVFRGIDSQLMNEKAAHMAPDDDHAKSLRQALWDDSAEERRVRLLPFLWKQVAKQGVIFGNPDKGSPVEVTNGFRVSYPGYSEILTGRAQDAVIKGNDPIQNPTETVLEFLTRKLNMKSALFGSWDTFRWIGEHKPGTIALNAGYQKAIGSPRVEELNRVQFEALPPWPEVRHDYVTCELAIEYLKRVKPRMLYISLGETDDWAHSRRYDRVLETATYFDQCVENVWRAAQAMPQYRSKTAILLTSDHGRGATLDDWNGHGAKVEGANRIWMAMLGAGVPPLGEVSNRPEVKQRDVAPTILTLLGIDPKEYKGVEGRTIRLK